MLLPRGVATPVVHDDAGQVGPGLKGLEQWVGVQREERGGAMETEEGGMGGVMDAAQNVDGFWDNIYDLGEHDDVGTAFSTQSVPLGSLPLGDDAGAVDIAAASREEPQHVMAPQDSAVCYEGTGDCARQDSGAVSDVADLNMSREHRFAAALHCRKAGKGVKPRQGCSSERLNRESKEGTRALEFSGFFAVVRHTADAETVRMHGHNAQQFNRPDYTRIEKPLLFAARITDECFGSQDWQRAISSIESKGFNELQWLARCTIAQHITTSKRQMRNNQIPKKIQQQLEAQERRRAQSVPQQPLGGHQQLLQQQQLQPQLKPDPELCAGPPHGALGAPLYAVGRQQAHLQQQQLHAQQQQQQRHAQQQQQQQQLHAQQQQQQQPPPKRQRGPGGGVAPTAAGPPASHPEHGPSGAAGAADNTPWDADLAIINPVVLRSKIERCLSDFLRQLHQDDQSRTSIEEMVR